MSKRITREEAQSFACPTCGMVSGVACLGVRNTYRLAPHNARYNAARAWRDRHKINAREAKRFRLLQDGTA